MAREIIELEDDGVSGIKVRLAAPNTMEPMLIIRTFDEDRTGPCVVLEATNVAKLMDFLNRNYDSQE